MPMVPVDATIEPRTGTGAEPAEPEVGGDLMMSALRQGNSLVSFMQERRNAGPFAPVPGYNPGEDETIKPFLESHPFAFSASRSPAETAAIARQITQENADRRNIAANGAAGFVAGLAAGGLDPVWALFPWGAARKAQGFFRAGASEAAKVAGLGAAQEAILQSTQQTRSGLESLENVGSMALLSGLIGGAAARVFKGDLPLVADALDRDRAKMDYEARGAPAPPTMDEHFPAGAPPRATVQNDVHTRLMEAGRSEDEATAGAAIMAAGFHSVASDLGRDPFELYQAEISGIRQAHLTKAREGLVSYDQSLRRTNPEMYVARVNGAVARVLEYLRYRRRPDIPDEDIVDFLHQYDIAEVPRGEMDAFFDAKDAARKAAKDERMREQVLDLEDEANLKAAHPSVRIAEQVYDLEADTNARLARITNSVLDLEDAANARKIDLRTKPGLTIAERKANRARRLFQEGPDGEARGRITFLEDGRKLIELFETADASTFAHETAHLFLDMRLRYGLAENAPSRLRGDATVLLDWLGIKSPTDRLTAKHHEQFARGFEQYLREGKAPNAALAQAFERFKTWLTEIYQSLAALGRPITDDVRKVMDNMLTAERARVEEPAPTAPRAGEPRPTRAAEPAPPGPFQANEPRPHDEPSPSAVVAEQVRRMEEELAERDPARYAEAETLGGDLRYSPEHLTKEPSRLAPADDLFGGRDFRLMPTGEPRPKRKPRRRQAQQSDLFEAEAGPLEKPGPQTPFSMERVRPEAEAAPPGKEQSLLEFIADQGGIHMGEKMIEDVRTLIGRRNKQVGMKWLIRKTGRPLDKVLEAAVEAGYLRDTSFAGGVAKRTTRDLLDLMDKELRGQKVFREGHEGHQTKADIEHEQEAARARLESDIAHAVEEAGGDPHRITNEDYDRTVELMTRDGIRDPLEAYERAVMEGTENGAEAGHNERIPEHIPGWDEVPAERGAAPAPGGPPGEGGEPAAGGQAPISGASTGGSVGAALADTRRVERASAFGLEKLPDGPQSRLLTSQSVNARRAVFDLSEVATLMKEQQQGIALRTGPALDNAMHAIIDTTRYAVSQELDRLWTDLRFAGGKKPMFAKTRDRFNEFIGEPPNEATYDSFKQMISEAMSNGDRSEIPQVQEAARFVRENVFDPWKERAIAAGLLQEGVEAKFAESYFSRLYNKQVINARRPEFVDILTKNLKRDQDTKAAAKDRIIGWNTPLQEIGGQVAKLEEKRDRLIQTRAKIEARKQERASETITEIDRAEGLDLHRMAHEDEMGLLKDSLSLLRDLKASKSYPLAAAQKAATAALDRVELAFREQRGKAGEASRSADLNQKRLDTLLERADHYKERQEIIEAALETSEQARAHLREKIEAELQAWEGKSSAEAKSALKAREKYELEAGINRPETGGRLKSADSAVDKAVKKIIESDRDLPVDELEEQAQEITRRILGSPDGRLPYDIESGGTQEGYKGDLNKEARGPLAARVHAIPDNEIRSFLEQDVEHVINAHLRTMVPDVMLAERFGDVGMTENFRKIEDEYGHLIKEAKTAKEREQLGKQRVKDLEALAGIRDRIRGIYGTDLYNAMPNLARTAAVMKSFNVITNLGMATISSVSDAAGGVFRYGMNVAFGDAYLPFLKSMMTGGELNREAVRQARALGLGLETLLTQRHFALNDVVESYKPQSRLERTLQWGADKFQLLNMLGPWTDRMKVAVFMMASQEIYRAADALTKGTHTSRQLQFLAESNIPPHVAEKIAKEYAESGQIVDGVHLPNTEKWKNREAREAFEGAVRREANIAVVSPGQEKSLIFSNPVLSPIVQFKSFTAAANQRILIANLQRRDAQAMQGLVFSVGLGMLSYKLNSMFGGQPTSDKPGDWLKEGISRGSVLGWIEEGNALTSKMTSGKADLYRLVGSDHPLSRYAGRSVVDQMLGPSVGKLVNAQKVIGAAARGDLGAGDITAGRKLVPLQNLFWLRGAFNQIEHGVNGAFGIPEKAAAVQ